MADKRFEVTMLPASEGDSLLITYGEEGALKRVLIDVGRKATYPHLKALLDTPAERSLELFVISHVDRDHIEGSIDLLEDEQAGFAFEDIWFNGYHHLKWQPDVEDFGAVQGERLTEAILTRGLPWNTAFGGAPVRLEDGDPLPVRTLPGGLKITLLSPSRTKLEALEPKWVAECQKAGLVPGAHPAPPPPQTAGVEEFGGESLDELASRKTSSDSAKPNGSSIAFIAEYDGKRALFGADAHPDLLAASLRTYGNGDPVALDLMKVSHHGSRANTTNAVMKLVRCRRFLVSTNGNYFDHPDEEALARLVVHQPEAVTIFFNYDRAKSRTFADMSVGEEQHPFSCTFPQQADQAVTVAV